MNVQKVKAMGSSSEQMNERDVKAGFKSKDEGMKGEEDRTISQVEQMSKKDE